MSSPQRFADCSQSIAECGIRSGNYLAVASISLVVHDYLISLHRETSLFWTGPSSLSTVLYISLRYLSLLQAINSTVSLISTRADNVLHVTVPLAFIIDILMAAVSQGVVTLRVWYLFKSKKPIRMLAVVSYVACIAGSVGVLALLSPGLLYEAAGVTNKNLDKGFSSPPGMWRLFMPSLMVHTIMFGLTLWKMKDVESLQRSSMMQLLQEGSFIYAFALIGLTLGMIYLAPAQTDKEYLAIATLHGQFQVSSIAVVTCRTMINLRSLADTLDVDPSWLLNTAELSRVRCRKQRRGELVVEMGPLDSPVSSEGDADNDIQF